MKKHVVLFFLATTAFQAETFACSCAGSKESEERQVTSAFQDATEVLVAKVESVRHPQIPGYTSGESTVEDTVFIVVEVLKGNKRLGDHLATRSSIGPGLCGRSARNDPPWIEPVSKGTPHESTSIQISDTWVVYGYGTEPYELSFCSRSSPLNVNGARDLKVLRGVISQSAR
jgi:hypothetical protein